MTDLKIFVIVILGPNAFLENLFGPKSCCDDLLPSCGAPVGTLDRQRWQAKTCLAGRHLRRMSGPHSSFTRDVPQFVCVLSLPGRGYKWILRIRTGNNDWRNVLHR